MRYEIIVSVFASQHRWDTHPAVPKDKAGAAQPQYR
jgi:hypothetical protein